MAPRIPIHTAAPHEHQSESKALSRADVAAARRNFEAVNQSLVDIQRHLLQAPLSDLNVNEVASQLMAAAQLRDTLKATVPLLTAALPKNTGGKLTDQERREIKGYYSTGRFTQEMLAEQYQVSQATIHNVIKTI